MRLFQKQVASVDDGPSKRAHVRNLADHDPDWMYHAQYIRQLLFLLDFSDNVEHEEVRRIFNKAGRWCDEGFKESKDDRLCPGNSSFLEKESRETFGVRNLSLFYRICRRMISDARPSWMKSRGLTPRDIGLFAARFGSFAECFQRAQLVPLEQFVPYLAEFADQNRDLPGSVRPYAISADDYELMYSRVEEPSDPLSLQIDNTKYLIHYYRRRHGLFLTTCALTASIRFYSRTEFRASLDSTYAGIRTSRHDLAHTTANRNGTTEEQIVWWWSRQPMGTARTFRTFQQLANLLRAVALCTSSSGEWDWESMGEKDKIGRDTEISFDSDEDNTDEGGHEDYIEEEISV